MPEAVRQVTDWSPRSAWAVVALAVVVSAWPTFPLHMVAGRDWSFELERVEQFRLSVVGLQFPPAIAPGDHHGWGGPLFLFSAPGFVGVGALASWAIGDLAAGAALAQWLFVAFGAASMAWLMRVLGSTWRAAAVGGAAFALHPWLLMERHVFSANGELAAISALPLVVAGVWLTRTRRTAAILAIAAGLALAIVCDAAVGLLAVVLVAVVAPLAGRTHRGAVAARISAGMVLGLAMASFYWAPAVALFRLTRAGAGGSGAIVSRLAGSGWTFAGALSIFTAAALAMLVDRPVLQGHARRSWAIASGALAVITVAAAPVLIDAMRLGAAGPAPVQGRSTAGDDYLPAAAQTAYAAANPGVESGVLRATGGGSAVAFSDTPTVFSMMVDSPRGTRLHLARWAFPSWIAATEHGRVPVGVGEHGEVVIDVPAGFHELWVEYRPPLVRRVTSGISALSAVGWLLILELALRRRARRLAARG